MGLAAEIETEPAAQMGALPWRPKAGGGIEVLMVTSRISGHWLIPKGWPMEGKSACEAARQEAFEEAGITGSISARELGTYRYDKLRKDGTTIECVVTVYPLRVDDELDDWQERRSRQRRWFTLQEAAEQAYEPGLRALLAMLDDRMVTSAVSAA